MMPEAVLCVDDEPRVLSGLQRTLRKNFKIITADSGLGALGVLDERDDVAVIVSDMSMPGMDGAQLLTHYRDHAPDTIRIMLTGNSDQESAVKAINEGAIFRFLGKPCASEVLIEAIDAGIKQYRLQKTEQDILKHTLNGTLKLLTEVLTLASPELFSEAVVLQNLAKNIADRMHMQESWQLETAVMILQLGWIGIPANVVENYKTRSHLMPAAELEMVTDRWKVVRSMVSGIPRLNVVSELIAHAYGMPVELPKELTKAGKIMHVLIAYIERTSKGENPLEILLDLKKTANHHDPEVVKIILELIEKNEACVIETVDIAGLQIGQVLVENVVSTNGQTLVRRGQVISEALKEKLKNYYNIGRLDDQFVVRTAKEQR